MSKDRPIVAYKKPRTGHDITRVILKVRSFIYGARGFSSLYLGRVVMYQLEHSLEDLQLPTCPICGIEMQWNGSALIRFIPATNLNLFNCPTCLLIAESETVCEPGPAQMVPQPAVQYGTVFLNSLSARR
jgi:hypothetical protein